MERIKKDFSTVSMLLIPIAVAINMIGGQINGALKLPLFLDTIGTILVSILCGPWVGLATVVIGKAVSSITNPGYFAFILVSIGITLVVGNFSKKGMLLSPVKIAITMLVTALVVAIIGSTVRIMFYGGITGDGTSVIISALLASGKAIVQSVFGSVFITNFLDKSISILLSLAIIKMIPNKYLIKYPLGELYINKEA